MSTRRAQIYVSGDILRALILIAKSASDEIRNVTAEDIAERMLSEAIATEYPKVLEHQKTVEKMERELVKTL